MTCISVIIPVYNAENYLVECIETLVNQTLQEIEIIFINDGSTDNSLEIIKKYSQKDNRITIINQENIGAGIARNNGIKIARGKYLSFLDADDFFELDMLKKTYNKAEKTSADICIFRSNSYDNTTKKSTTMSYAIRDFLMPDKEVFSSTEIKIDIFKSCVGWAWDKLFLADFVKRNNLLFQDLRTTNDLSFVYSALVVAEKITILDEYLISHRENISTSLSETREKSCECFYLALNQLKLFLVKNNLYELYKMDFINYALHFSLWQLNTLDRLSCQQIYDKLKFEWFNEFEIDTLRQSNVYRLKEFKQYQNIKNLPFEKSQYCKKNKNPNKIMKTLKKVKIPNKLREILYNLRDNGVGRFLDTTKKL